MIVMVDVTEEFQSNSPVSDLEQRVPDQLFRPSSITGDLYVLFSFFRGRD